MKILNQTQGEKDIITLQAGINRALRAVITAKDELNRAHAETWSLPEDRLIIILQSLYDSGKLIEMFENHYIAATAINTILDSVEYVGNRAIAKAAKEIAVEDGQVSFVEQTIEDGVLDNLDSESIIIEDPIVEKL